MNKNKRIAPLCGAGVLFYIFCSASGGLGAQQPISQEAPRGARRLSLAEAVAMALQNNRSVQLAQTAVLRAAAEHKEALSPFRPQVFLGSGLAATKGYPLSIEGAAPSIFQVSAQQALLNSNLRNLEKQAGQMQAAVEKSLEEKRDDVVAQTVLSYLDLDRSRRSLEHMRSHTQTLLEAEQIMGERVEAGLEPPVEGTRAKLNTARSRRGTVGLENQIAMLEFTLRDLTGIPQSEAIVVEQAEVPALPADETLEQLVARALENNPAIQAIEEEIRAKQYRVRAEQGWWRPKVNLVGEYGLFSDINNYSQYFAKFTRNNATLGVSIVVPLYQRDLSSARMSKAQAELADASLRRDDARAGVARQVRQMWGEVQQQSAAGEVARLDLEVARRSLDAVLAQYEDGRVNRLAVEQARSQEEQKWVDFFDAGYQAEKARLELLRISGGIRNVFH